MVFFSFLNYTSIRLLSLGAPFLYVFFFISMALSLSIMRAKHYPRRKWHEGGRNKQKVETNCVRIWSNKKYFKTRILLAVLSHLRILYQEKYVNKNKNKKILKTTLLRTTRRVGGAKRIQIWNRNLQTKITISLCASYASTCPQKRSFKNLFIYYYFLKLKYNNFLKQYF